MFCGLFNGASLRQRYMDAGCRVCERMAGDRLEGLLLNRLGLLSRYLVILSVMCLPVPILAANGVQPGSTPHLRVGSDLPASDSDRKWLRWFDKQITQHPVIEAGRQRLEAAYSRTADRQQPLYNPELETEFDWQGGEANYQLGLSQNIDWQGKRAQGRKLSRLHEAQAQQRFSLLIQQRYARVLIALIERQAVVQKAQLASNDEAQLEALLQQVEARHQAGDLGALDAELAFLSLTQRLSRTAQAMVELKMANARLRELLPDWSEQQSQFSRRVLYSAPTPQSQIGLNQIGANQLEPVEQWVELHPLVVVAKLRWQVAQQDIELMALSTRSDPNVGINVGSSDDDSLLGLKFSMPLKIRNNNGAALSASRQHAFETESLYRAAHTKQRIAIETSQTVLDTYRRHYGRWQSLVAGKGEHLRTTLLNRWSAGDINTTEYLQTLQQYSESQWAGIELKRQIDLAQVNWLVQTGQVVTHFNDTKEFE